MYLNQFSVRVPEGRETTSGYVEIEHGKQYTLVLRNDRSRRCNAEVSIDGKRIGTFRIQAHGNIRLERKPDDEGRFTFYRPGSTAAERADLGSVSASDLGLVKVVFTPESQPVTIIYPYYSRPYYPYSYEQPWYPCADTSATISVDESDTSIAANCLATNNPSYSVTASCSSRGDGQSAGGTGLSGHSDQQFREVGDMCLDYCQQTTIHLRLVEGSKQDEPRPLRPVQTSNPIPSPVISDVALSFSNGASIRIGEEGQLIIDGGGKEICFINHTPKDEKQ